VTAEQRPPCISGDRCNWVRSGELGTYDRPGKDRDKNWWYCFRYTRRLSPKPAGMPMRCVACRQEFADEEGMT
jgi:hypothetical protein